MAGIVYKLMKEQGEWQACTFTLFLELYSMDPCAEKTNFSSRAECHLSTMRRKVSKVQNGRLTQEIQLQQQVWEEVKRTSKRKGP